MLRSTLLLAGLFPLAALAQDAKTDTDGESHTEHAEMERVVVSALPIARSKLESAQPIDVLSGEALDDRRGLTLGETLTRQPGVHSTSYGPGSGRPVIRGLGAGRVQVLEDSLPAVDVSAQSDDHAVSVEPMLIDRVEILRGPSTLLFGSGAVGGVVNVIDGRIPERVPAESLEGRFELRGNTVADERTGVLRLDGGSGNWAWNISGTWRDAGDYEIPGLAEAEPEEEHDGEEQGHEEDETFGVLPNSFVESKSGSAGLSWIGSRGFFGVSIKQFETDYGVPAPHAHENEEEHDEHGLDAFRYARLSEDDHEDEQGEQEENVFIDLEQTRWDAKGALNEPLPGFIRATLRTSYSDYTHAERDVGGGHEEEGEAHDDEHGPEGAHTIFDVQAWNARLEMEHQPVAGWRGALGFQFENKTLSAMGEEAYIPDGDTRSWALFALEEKRTGPLTWTLGARVERNEIEVDELLENHDHEEELASDGPTRRSFTTVSGSAGVLWRIDERWQTSLNYAYAERAPSQGDLFANGPHAATFTFERGASDLDEEVTNGLDFIVHRHGDDFDVEASLFYNAIDDFIYLDETGEELDGLPLRQTRQQDATFYGGELQAVWHLPRTAAGHFDLRAGYDWVRAELDSGENLPRISPARYTAGLDWHRGDLRGSLEYQHVTSADDLAPNETPTDGYDMLDLNASYFFALGGADLEAFAKLSNLLDEEARVHTSFLKNFAPLPGRNVGFGLRGRF
ncbi:MULTISPECIES: TonB-dependent receptor [unclassified Wenzhouxiangella]|uniref:TonB-dependent receptor n=1 Tax=unclassified Wenzhouxiangella TaxID=2613841 RepID=UPI000E325A69|nr:MULTISPECIES: TonB-dependent receptor [unclassified Wenzhouxiangella]RFF28857.1 TonB-dependent receptor [Wenzhouxiangella sp. 15181]RFP68166.1 TonB-dependent receptor [Wenzhouxiangella sp. 15190]